MRCSRVSTDPSDRYVGMGPFRSARICAESAMLQALCQLDSWRDRRGWSMQHLVDLVAEIDRACREYRNADKRPQQQIGPIGEGAGLLRGDDGHDELPPNDPENDQRD